MKEVLNGPWIDPAAFPNWVKCSEPEPRLVLAEKYVNVFDVLIVFLDLPLEILHQMKKVIDLKKIDSVIIQCFSFTFGCYFIHPLLHFFSKIEAFCNLFISMVVSLNQVYITFWKFFNLNFCRSFSSSDLHNRYCVTEVINCFTVTLHTYLTRFTYYFSRTFIQLFKSLKP